MRWQKLLLPISASFSWFLLINAIVGRAITIERAIIKRKQIKPVPKMKQRRLRTIKLQGAIEKSFAILEILIIS